MLFQNTIRFLMTSFYLHNSWHACIFDSDCLWSQPILASIINYWRRKLLYFIDNTPVVQPLKYITNWKWAEFVHCERERAYSTGRIYAAILTVFSGCPSPLLPLPSLVSRSPRARSNSRFLRVNKMFVRRTKSFCHRFLTIGVWNLLNPSYPQNEQCFQC